MAMGASGTTPTAGAGRARLVTWIPIVRAVVVLALGAAWLVTGDNRPLLGNLLATYWLAGAVLTLGWVAANRGRSGSRLALIGGLAGVLAAVIGLTRFLIESVVSVDGALALVGVSAVVIGSLRLAGAVRDERRPHERPLRRIILGLSEIALGVVFIATDDVSRTMTTAAGLWAAVGGTFMLLDALAACETAGHADPR
jgi:hypothetical protein